MLITTLWLSFDSASAELRLLRPHHCLLVLLLLQPRRGCLLLKPLLPLLRFGVHQLPPLVSAPIELGHALFPIHAVVIVRAGIPLPHYDLVVAEQTKLVNLGVIVQIVLGCQGTDLALLFLEVSESRVERPVVEGRIELRGLDQLGQRG